MMRRSTYFLPQDSGSEVDLNGIDILLHQEMFAGHHLAAAADVPFPESAAALLNQDLGDLISGDPAASVANTSQTKPTVVKKDRHSKIFTAQGPRDRRVRLSIDIARKFFDLQEMLGFDKPSKTLDWLLTKSRTAIKELVQTKQTGSGSSPSECDEVLSSEGNEEALERRNSLGPNSRRKSGGKGSKDPQQQAALNHARESRAKARARARERTREKMCIKQINGAGSDLNPSVRYQYGDNQFEDYRLSAVSSRSNLSCTFNANAATLNCALSNEVASDGLIQRTSKNPSFMGFQQNLNFSKDLSPNYGFPSDINAAENWDFCSFTSQSDLCAIWDQHKFINSTSNQ